MNNIYHHCQYCNSEFKKKRNWYEHEIVCELIYKFNNDYDIDTDLFTLENINKVLIQVVRKQTELEKEIKKIKQQVVIKVNILDWINKNLLPKTTISTFINEMSKMNLSIEYFLEEPIHESLKTVINNNLNRYKSKNVKYLDWPIFSYKNKLYVYDFTSKVWKEEYNICQLIYNEWTNISIDLLNQWKQNNFNNINDSLEKKFHLAILYLVDDTKEKTNIRLIKSLLIQNINSNISTISYQII